MVKLQAEDLVQLIPYFMMIICFDQLRGLIFDFMRGCNTFLLNNLGARRSRREINRKRESV